MTKIDIAKKVLSITAALGSGAITNQIIQNNVRPNSPLQQVTVPVASFVLGGLVARTAREESGKIVDDLVEAWTSFTKKN